MHHKEPTPPVKPPTPFPATPAGLEERIFPTGRLRLNAAIGPAAGPSLLLLHGVTRCWQDWLPLLPEFTKQWRVIALDHRGHGGSSRDEGGYQVSDYAGDAVRFLELHVDGPVTLIGHSLGALTAAMVAARAPERIRALVLEDPPGTTLADGLLESRFALQFNGVHRLLATPRGAEQLALALADLPVQRPSDGAVVKFRELRDEAALRFGAECLVRMDPRVLDSIVAGRWLEGIDWFSELRRIRCPTLLLRADPACGGMLSTAEADRITALIPCCKRVDLPGVGHSIHSSVPARTLELVNQFLDTLQPLRLR